MESTIEVAGKRFQRFIPREEIDLAVGRVARQINEDLADASPMFVCVLNGAFIFAADLFRQITIPGSEITFVRMKSYVGTQSTGKVKTVTGLVDSVVDRTVVIVEDICDSGYTIDRLIKQLLDLGAKEVYVAVLFDKPDAHKVPDFTIDYTCMEIGNEFIVGYGLDYNEQGRNLPEIYIEA